MFVILVPQKDFLFCSLYTNNDLLIPSTVYIVYVLQNPDELLTYFPSTVNVIISFRCDSYNEMVENVPDVMSCRVYCT